MPRALEQLPQPGLLHELPGVHHADAVADLGDDAEVVGDVEDGRVELPLELGDQVEDDRLGGHVQGGRRLVHDQQRGVGHQRHGDHAALQHAAAELVRVAPHHRLGIGHRDLGEHLADARHAPRALSMPRCWRATSASCLPMTIEGLSALSGLW